MNFAAGLALIRLLPTSEFSMFTVAFTALTMANIIADGGAGSALNAMAAPIITGAPGQLRALYNAVLRTRLRLALLALAVSLPLLAYTLARLGVGRWRVVAAGVLCVAYMSFGIQQSAGTVLLRLQRRYHQIQAMDFTAGLIRLTLWVTVVRHARSGLVALALTVGMLALQAATVRYLTRGCLSSAPDPDTFTPRLASVLRHALPGTLFYALQGQVTVVLLAIFAGQAEVAGAGALARISVVFTLVSPAITNVLAPAFATVQAARARRIFVGVVAGAVGAGALMVGATALGSRLLLVLLGPQYAHLNVELRLMAGTAAIGFVSSTVGELNKVRAWVRSSWLVIPSVLGVQAVALTTLRVDTLRGALLFGLASSVPSLAVGLYQAWAGPPVRLNAARPVTNPAGSSY